MLCAGTCRSSGQDFETFGNVFFQKFYIFVINFIYFVFAEIANFLSASVHISVVGISVSVLHGNVLLSELKWDIQIVDFLESFHRYAKVFTFAVLTFRCV